MAHLSDHLTPTTLTPEETADRMPWVYLDYAASAPVRPEVTQAMLPWMGLLGGGNPSAVHRAGRRARAAVEDARDQIAAALGVTPLEVIFTSGATEANNLAIYGAIQAAQGEDGRSLAMVSGGTDHPSITKPLAYLAKRGDITSTVVNPAPFGTPDCGVIGAAQIADALSPETVMVLGTLVTSELGAIQPIHDWIDQAIFPDYGSVASKAGPKVGNPTRSGPWVHLDITQAIGKLPIAPFSMAATDQRITSLALSAHKVGGPQGVGVLAVDRAKSIISPILGGSQERGIRSGTIPVALAVGAGEAVALAVAEQGEEATRLHTLKTQLLSALAGSGWEPTVDPANQIASTCHLTKAKVDPDTTMMALDQGGLCVSAGTACQSGAVQASSLIASLSLPEDRATVRLSMGWATTESDIAHAVKVLTTIA